MKLTYDELIKLLESNEIRVIESTRELETGNLVLKLGPCAVVQAGDGMPRDADVAQGLVESIESYVGKAVDAFEVFRRARQEALAAAASARDRAISLLKEHGFDARDCSSRQGEDPLNGITIRLGF